VTSKESRHPRFTSEDGHVVGLLDDNESRRDVVIVRNMLMESPMK
jgi:hypothetical protein